MLVTDDEGVPEGERVGAGVSEDERVIVPEPVYEGELVAVAAAERERLGGDVAEADDAEGVADVVAAGEAEPAAVGEGEGEAGTDGVPVTAAVELAETNRVIEAVDVGLAEAVPEGVPAGDALADALADDVCVGVDVAGGGMAQTSVSWAMVCKP